MRCNLKFCHYLGFGEKVITRYRQYFLFGSFQKFLESPKVIHKPALLIRTKILC